MTAFDAVLIPQSVREGSGANLIAPRLSAIKTSKTADVCNVADSLEDRLFNRLQSGEIVEMAALEGGGNYDSANRALRNLVKKRKAVRVGRGRYLAARGASSSTGSIKDAITRKVGRSSRNVFLRADFDGLGSYDSVGRALKGLIKEGRLMSVGYGLYAKAAPSPFTGKPVPVIGIKLLATEALRRLGKSVAPSGYETAYNERRSTQVPTGRTLAVKDRVSRRIGYDGKYVVLERS
jgi:hypothetical protein